MLGEKLGYINLIGPIFSSNVGTCCHMLGCPVYFLEIKPSLFALLVGLFPPLLHNEPLLRNLVILKYTLDIFFFSPRTGHLDKFAKQ